MWILGLLATGYFVLVNAFTLLFTRYGWPGAVLAVAAGGAVACVMTLRRSRKFVAVGSEDIVIHDGDDRFERYRWEDTTPARFESSTVIVFEVGAKVVYLPCGEYFHWVSADSYRCIRAINRFRTEALESRRHAERA